MVVGTWMFTSASTTASAATRFAFQGGDGLGGAAMRFAAILLRFLCCISSATRFITLKSFPNYAFLAAQS